MTGDMMTNPDVDVYVEHSERWPDEITALRPILTGCGLVEQIKWRQPCYTHDGSNILILQETRRFLAVMFFKGALLTDSHDVLEDQGPNSRSARRVRITSVDDVTLRTAFEALTPGRQREYDLHVSEAKQASTRTLRVEKHVPRILDGRGLRDR